MEHFTKQERIYTLIGLLMALFLGALDQTIVATALPKIVDDLQGLSRFAWVATAYLVASTAFVPLYGKLADMYNKKYIELISMSLFLIGSFLCGISGEFGSLPLLGDGMNQLIIFRAIQGIGGAGLFGMAFIIIADLFPPKVRGKYQGFVGAVFGIASVMGPWVGGLLTDYGSAIIPGIEGWRWVFYVNVPFGALAIWFVAVKMPHLPARTQRQPVSIPNALALILGLSALIIALQTDKTVHPWNSFYTVSLLAVAFALLTFFSVRSIKSANPILDFKLFRNKVFSTSNIALFFFGAAFFSIIIFLPLFMINVLGVSATRAGITLIPLSLGLVAGSIVSGQLVSRFGHYKRWMLGGATLLLVGVILLWQMTPEIPYWQVTAYMLLCGLAIGPSMPLFTLAIQNAVPLEKMGQATSASQFFRQIGGAIGAAVMGTVLTTTLVTYFAANLGSFAPDTNFSTEGNVKSTGGSEMVDKVHEEMDKSYQLLAEAVVNNDAMAKERLLDNPILPADIKRQLSNGSISAEALPALEKQLHSHAEEVAEQVEYTIRAGFAEAITNIYFYSIFIVIFAIISTLFVPELKLRTTNEYIPGEM